ncbi:MAG: hypothetical protein HRT38_04145 [Alteromonadaceae bacterium]|nr:hypothetical protein [Alteromonadaceae bacterium]
MYNVVLFKQKLSKKTAASISVLATLVSTISTSALAMTAPDNVNSFGGQAYDLIINQGYSSGLGYVIAGGLLVWGFMGLKTDWKDSAYKGVAGTGVATMPAVLTGLGMNVF